LTKQNGVLLDQLLDLFYQLLALHFRLSVSVEALHFDNTLGDFVLSNPNNQRNSSIEGVLNLLGHLWVVIVENLSTNVSLPEFTQNLESFGSQVFANLGNHDLSPGRSNILLLKCFLFKN
jgi:hypothetical protein